MIANDKTVRILNNLDDCENFVKDHKKNTAKAGLDHMTDFFDKIEIIIMCIQMEHVSIMAKKMQWQE
jgi:hypothetical protein